MISDVKSLLKKLDLQDTGRYENHFYIISLEDSNEYARMYTKLCKNAVNTEFPDFQSNTNHNTTRITNYFEVEDAAITYNIFLIADFEKDSYLLKIGER